RRCPCPRARRAVAHPPCPAWLVRLRGTRTCRASSEREDRVAFRCEALQTWQAARAWDGVVAYEVEAAPFRFIAGPEHIRAAGRDARDRVFDRLVEPVCRVIGLEQNARPSGARTLKQHLDVLLLLL